MINMIYMNTVNYSCLRNNQPKLTSVVIICCNFFRHKKGYAIFVGIAYPSWYIIKGFERRGEMIVSDEYSF